MNQTLLILLILKQIGNLRSREELMRGFCSRTVLLPEDPQDGRSDPQAGRGEREAGLQVRDGGRHSLQRQVVQVC